MRLRYRVHRAANRRGGTATIPGFTPPAPAATSVV